MLLHALDLAQARLDAFEQMALDEALLGCACADDLILRFFRWKGPAVTFGYGQAYQLAASAAQKRLGAVPVVRRSTGGGVVFHDGDVTFSLIFPWERLCAPSLIYKNIHRGIHLGLKTAGIQSRLWSDGCKSTVAALSKQCFTAPETMDLVDESGRKVLGGALRRRAGVGLYQGSLRPEIFGVAIETLENAITDGIARQWGRPASRRVDATPEDLAPLIEKYKSRRWNEKR